MSGGSTLARVWVQAIVCGAGCGASSGVGVLLVATAIDHRGYTTLGFVLGIPILSFYAGVIGGLLGLVIGVPTGLVAGLTLEASLRRMTPRAAIWTTVMLVLAAQVVAEIALVEVPRWGTLWAFARRTRDHRLPARPGGLPSRAGRRDPAGRPARYVDRVTEDARTTETVDG